MARGISSGNLDDVNFDEMFSEEAPKPGILKRIEEKLYGLIRRAPKIQKKGTTERRMPDASADVVQEKAVPADDLFEDKKPEIPSGMEVQNGLLIRKKTIAEKVAFQLKHSLADKASKIFVQGLALSTFCIGSFMVYSEIPLHPELVLGIILVTVSGNIIIASVR